MNHFTKAVLAELHRMAWFTNVGQPVVFSSTVKVLNQPVPGFACKGLTSWKEAVDWCRSQMWEDAVLEAGNRIGDRLVASSYQRYNEWNKIVQENEGFVRRLVSEKIQEVVAENKLPEIFERTVYGGIGGFVIESEYSDIVKPGFFHLVVYWYLEGHFPCGWEGEFPEGKLVVF